MADKLTCGRLKVVVNPQSSSPFLIARGNEPFSLICRFSVTPPGERFLPQGFRCTYLMHMIWPQVRVVSI